jgi:hypothetical protein
LGHRYYFTASPEGRDEAPHLTGSSFCRHLILTYQFANSFTAIFPAFEDNCPPAFGLTLRTSYSAAFDTGAIGSVVLFALVVGDLREFLNQSRNNPGRLVSFQI